MNIAAIQPLNREYRVSDACAVALAFPSGCDIVPVTGWIDLGEAMVALKTERRVFLWNVTLCDFPYPDRF
jgi:hypothetical protein